MMAEKKWATTFLIAICILMTILAIISDGYEGGADTVGHYLYSRHAINNPILLLDLWGRPIFTLFGNSICATWLYNNEVLLYPFIFINRLDRI